MPRRREVTKREILADPKYKSTLVAKFINNVMRAGEEERGRENSLPRDGDYSGARPRKTR